MNFGKKIITWYDRSLQLWTATYQNDTGDQLGAAGYASTKQGAIGDLVYQNSIPQPYKSVAINIDNIDNIGD